MMTGDHSAFEHGGLVDDAPYWTAERRELANWFAERAPAFLEAYVAAVRLLHLPDFPARVHIVCHLIRDIYRYLPRELGHGRANSSAGEVYSQPVRVLRTAWKADPFRDEEVPPGHPRQVTPEVYQALERLMEKSLGLEAQSSLGVQLYQALLRSVERPSEGDAPHWASSAFDKDHKFFVERAHINASGQKAAAQLPESFADFERAFLAMIGPYFRRKDELDAILEDTNRRTG